MATTYRHFLPGLVLTALTACGGGVGEVIAVLGYAGAAGGAWVRDFDTTTAKADSRNTCGDDGTATCQIIVSLPNGTDDFASSYAIAGNGDVGSGVACAPDSAGTVNGRSFKLPCFSGQFRNVNEMLSDDGKIRLLFDFRPRFIAGSWVDIEHTDYRLKFRDDDGTTTATGCEYDAASTGAFTLTYVSSDVFNGVFASITSVVITRGAQSETWAAEYVGASGLKLSRNGVVRQLERRQSTDTCV